MSTLIELGLRIIGNYIGGDRGGIQLNEKGAGYFRDLYFDARITQGAGVEMGKKLSEDHQRDSATSIKIFGQREHESLVFLGKDDFFQRRASSEN